MDQNITNRPRSDLQRYIIHLICLCTSAEFHFRGGGQKLTTVNLVGVENTELLSNSNVG